MNSEESNFRADRSFRRVGGFSADILQSGQTALPDFQSIHHFVFPVGLDNGRKTLEDGEFSVRIR